MWVIGESELWNNISSLRHIQYIQERERDVVSPAQFSENSLSDLYTKHIQFFSNL